jgi:hypothetical protein
MIYQLSSLVGIASFMQASQALTVKAVTSFVLAIISR